MKFWFLLPFQLFYLSSSLAQADTTANASERALEKVFFALSNNEAHLLSMDETIALLQKSPWEALAYLEEAHGMARGSIQEAVPDYYHFKTDRCEIHLLHPNGQNQVIEVIYQVMRNQIFLLDSKTSEKKDTWDIIYLDKNYLALDMGEIRLFFTHVPEKN